ncbi:MAG TPA: hypothetical protein VD838_01295 [Anaeromyxobacteraceae bacterium]|nr:hypothetical protein [Anaeromyxobacteraceae bacterium]
MLLVLGLGPLPAGAAVLAQETVPEVTIPPNENLDEAVAILRSVTPGLAGEIDAVRAHGDFGFGPLPESPEGKVVALYLPGEIGPDGQPSIDRLIVNSDYVAADPRDLAAYLAHEATHRAQTLSDPTFYTSGFGCYSTETDALMVEIAVWRQTRNVEPTVRAVNPISASELFRGLGAEAQRLADIEEDANGDPCKFVELVVNEVGTKANFAYQDQCARFRNPISLPTAELFTVAACVVNEAEAATAVAGATATALNPASATGTATSRATLTPAAATSNGTPIGSVAGSSLATNNPGSAVSPSDVDPASANDPPTGTPTDLPVSGGLAAGGALAAAAAASLVGFALRRRR